METDQQTDAPHGAEMVCWKMELTGFNPVLGPSPLVLILGSMPGRRSLEVGKYYGHPRNAFWQIMGDLGLCKIEDTYEFRLQSLADARVALWDVLGGCDREGSLDADIVAGSERVNPLDQLLMEYPTIRAVIFNGAKAEALFRRHILPGLSKERSSAIAFLYLPSTSSAYAIPYADKLQAWRRIVSFLEQ
jgi:hypoxanthine-DNA glycosylase